MDSRDSGDSDTESGESGDTADTRDSGDSGGSGGSSASDTVSDTSPVGAAELCGDPVSWSEHANQGKAGTLEFQTVSPATMEIELLFDTTHDNSEAN